MKKFTLTLPIRPPDFELCSPDYELFLEQVVTFSENKDLIDLICREDDGVKRIDNIKFSLKIGKTPDDNNIAFAKEIHQNHSFFATAFILDYLIIEVDYVFNHREDEYDFIGYHLNSLIQRLSLIIILSYQTSVDFLSGVIYSDMNEFAGRTDFICNNIGYSYRHADLVKWPTIKKISINETIGWFKKYSIHPNQISKNNLHRAINALTYIISDLKEDTSSQLFWIVLGIEALLAEGNKDILNQIKVKSSLVLGQPQEYKKKLNKLYDYRSRLIHGDFDIFPKFHSDYVAFSKEYYEYVEFATSILLALIKELIHKQDDSFKFELKLIN